jgi:multimeric flavodoxin WrbA
MQILSLRTKPRLMVFQGSPRNKENCPDQWGKTRRILARALKAVEGEAEIDLCDLSITLRGARVQPCKACISTAGGFHCNFKCSCYDKNSRELPDFMHDEDVYGRLERCDGFAVFCPINWYSVPSQVKACFDRLVCANATITEEQALALKILKPGGGKDAAVSRAIEKGGQHDHLLKNHLEGRYAAFFVHGDNGAADYGEWATGKPPAPASWRQHANAKDREGATNDPRQAILPIVWQCRYSGIFVPDDLVVALHMNEGRSYSEGNDRLEQNEDGLRQAEDLMRRLVRYLQA